MKLPEHLRVMRDDQAQQQGNRHANPVLGDMYPLTSMSMMSTQFAQLYSIGFTEGAQAVLEEAEKLAQALDKINQFYDGSPGKNYRASKALQAYREKFEAKP